MQLLGDDPPGAMTDNRSMRPARQSNDPWLSKTVSHHKLEGRENDLALDQHLMVADMEVGERTWHINGGCGRMMRRMTDQGKLSLLRECWGHKLKCLDVCEAGWSMTRQAARGKTLGNRKPNTSLDRERGRFDYLGRSGIFSDTSCLRTTFDRRSLSET